MVLTLIVLAGAVLRFDRLGARSLWLDELSTWHVSRMPLGESLRWGPELTKPPLFQLILRATTDNSHLSEAQLRFPAAVAGVLVIPAGYWLGTIMAGRAVGLALAAMLCCQLLHIRYSQEARSYSLLVLGSILATAFWYRLVCTRQRAAAAGYAAVAVLTVYAHYLMVLTLAGHVLWWLTCVGRNRGRRRARLPAVALALTAVACAPLCVHYARHQSTVFQGLAWIPAVSWSRALDSLGALTYGPAWVALLVVSLVCWWWRERISARAVAATQSSPPPKEAGGNLPPGVGLLWYWFGCAWLGLIVISWLAQPALVDRYALPASIPALLLPVLVISRMRHSAPLFLAAIVCAASAPDWAMYRWDVRPGFREMVVYLRDHTDPQKDVVVQVIDNATYPGWEDMERLGFAYYPLNGRPVLELTLRPDGAAADAGVFDDPRRLYLVAFRADPIPIIERANRRLEPFAVDGEYYSQLLFEPYRLVKVAPVELRAPESR